MGTPALDPNSEVGFLLRDRNLADACIDHPCVGSEVNDGTRQLCRTHSAHEMPFRVSSSGEAPNMQSVLNRTR